MGLKQEVERLHNSKEFKEWKKQNKQTYLVHGFIMLKGDKQTAWQIGYYDKKADKVTAFFMEEKIKISPPADIFKKQGILHKLDIDKIKINLDKALDIAEREQKKHKEIIAETIAILQNLDMGTVWNITYLTKSFNVINLKIDAINGKILHQNKTSFLQYKAS